MKKIIVIMILLISICLCSCNKTDLPIEQDTVDKFFDSTNNNRDELTEEESSESTIISDDSGINNSRPTNSLWLHLDSEDKFKAFLNKETRDSVFENYHISLSNDEIERLCVISDSLVNETIHTISDNWDSISIRDFTYSSNPRYTYAYRCENFFVEFKVYMSEEQRSVLIEQGISEFYKMLMKSYTLTDEGFISASGISYTPIKITIDNQELDALFVTETSSKYLVFELNGQVAMVYLQYIATFEEYIQVAENVGIHIWNME